MADKTTGETYTARETDNTYLNHGFIVSTVVKVPESPVNVLELRIGVFR